MELEKTLDSLKELVAKELEKIEKKGDMNPAELKNATDAVCLLMKIEKLQNGGMMDEEEYSESPYYHYPYSGRRGRNARTGRYMSMNRGYSRHSIQDRMVAKLEQMMDETNSDYERETIEAWIAKLEAN